MRLAYVRNALNRKHTLEATRDLGWTMNEFGRVYRVHILAHFLQKGKYISQFHQIGEYYWGKRNIRGRFSPPLGAGMALRTPHNGQADTCRQGNSATPCLMKYQGTPTTPVRGRYLARIR